MIRFSLRSRNKGDARRPPADRPQKPPGKPTFAPRVAPPAQPASFLVNYDALPKRRPDGLALHYPAYEPSQYHVASPAAHTRRRGRAVAGHPPKDAVVDALERPASVGMDLGLDFDSMQRNKQRGGDLLQFVPVEKRIRAKIAELRGLLTAAEQLGGIEVLKDLVGIHEANLANQKHAAQTARSQIKEAKIIAGIADSPVVPDATETRSTLIRKVSGKPMRHISGRTVSALKARTASMRSASRANQKNSTENRTEDTRPQRREHTAPGPPNGKLELGGKLSRKSSARLKRLGSAGGVLIRRLSKVSVAEDASTGSSGEVPVSSTFDQETMKKLKASPAEVLAEYEAALKRVHLAEEAENDKLREARARLENRRSIHDKAMAILDQFYGSLPGWEQDPISMRMLPDTAEMTEAGLEAERDLSEMRVMRERAYAAYEDHGRCLKALRFVSSTMGQFIEQLETLVVSIDDCEEAYRARQGVVNINGDVLNGILRDLEKLLKKCVRQAGVAGACCTEAPRVGQIGRDVGKLEEGFAREAEAVMTQGTVYKYDFAPTLQVAKAGLCDCKLAETFITERHKMIGEDLETFDGRVERYEEYVMLERVGILDMYHPS